MKNLTGEQYAASKYNELLVREPATLLDFLMKEMTGISRNKAKDILQGRGIMVDRRLVTRYDFLLEPGMVVRVSKHRRKMELDSRWLRIVYEDKDIIVVEKQPGILSAASTGGQFCVKTILDEYFVRRHFKCHAHVVHRLDRPVSGLVVFARTSKALTRLNRMFAESEVHKTYWAIVKGEKARSEESCDDGEWHTLEHWLVRNEKQNKSYAYDHEKPNARKAILKYRAIGHSDRYTLLEVNLMTGRHHQIRCQLAAMGCPIRGDLKYGAPRSNPDGSISLMSRRIEFVHPVSKENIEVEAPLPEDPLWQTLGASADQHR